MREPHPTVCVLGASGLVGRTLTHRLARREIRLRLVSRQAPPVPADATADIEVQAVDLTTPGAMARAVAGADLIVHLVTHRAGPASWRIEDHDETARRVNVGLVGDLVSALDAGRRAAPPTVVFAGSVSVAGGSVSGPVDGTETDDPLSVYDRQKLAGERVLAEAMAHGRLLAVPLRLATVYGGAGAPARLDHGVVAAMIRRALAGEPLTVWHDGAVLRDLVCVDDVARAVDHALDHAEALAGRPWPVGTGVGTSVRRLFTLIAAEVADQTGRPPVPVTGLDPEGRSVGSDTIDFVCDPAPLWEACGWRSTVPLPTGLRRLVHEIARQRVRGGDAA